MMASVVWLTWRRRLSLPLRISVLLSATMLAVPMALLWPGGAPWPVRTIPVSLNTVQHPLPSPARCYRLGQAIGRQNWTGSRATMNMTTTPPRANIAWRCAMT